MAEVEAVVEDNSLSDGATDAVQEVPEAVDQPAVTEPEPTAEEPVEVQAALPVPPVLENAALPVPPTLAEAPAVPTQFAAEASEAEPAADTPVDAASDPSKPETSSNRKVQEKLAELAQSGICNSSEVFGADMAEQLICACRR